MLNIYSRITETLFSESHIGVKQKLSHDLIGTKQDQLFNNSLNPNPHYMQSNRLEGRFNHEDLITLLPILGGQSNLSILFENHRAP